VFLLYVPPVLLPPGWALLEAPAPDLDPPAVVDVLPYFVLPGFIFEMN